MSTTIATSNKPYFTVYTLDIDSNVTNKVNIITTDFEKFTNKIFVQDLSANNKKSFKFDENSPTLPLKLEELMVNWDQDNFDALFEELSDFLAKKLLKAQIKKRDQHPGISAPKKGNLVFVCLKREDKFEFLLSKIDQAIFLDLVDSKFKAGLPEEKATQKSCSIVYKVEDGENKILDITVSDTNQKISSFWTDDFLEVIELNSNEKNTKTAFNAVEGVLTSYVKRKSLKDYTELRNTLVGYFQTKTSFKYDDMIDYVIGDYTPKDENVKIDELKSRLNTLPAKKSFDTAFDIDNSQIKTRFKRTYKVSDKIEIRTSDYIEDLKKVIIAKEDEFGEKILVIKNIEKELYETFKSEEGWVRWKEY